MIERIFAPALAFIVAIGSALAIATAWFDSSSTVQTVRLPSVEIVVTRPLVPTSLAASMRTETTSNVQ